ncbi:MAG: hypothetical protein KDD69_10365, partial [Bdellovibrionales bacterium]|nr:hypothetical protein [Bdellovibrionales bacterium]
AVETVGERLRGLTPPLLALAGQQANQSSFRLGALVRRAADGMGRVVERCELQLSSGRELVRMAGWHLEQGERALLHLERLVEEAGPATQLRRGFALIRDKDGQYLVGGAQLGSGDAVELEFFDTTKKATID